MCCKRTHKRRSVLCGNQHRTTRHEQIRIDPELLADFHRFLTNRNAFQINVQSASGSFCQFPECPKDASLGNIVHGTDAGFHGNSALRHNRKILVKALRFPHETLAKDTKKLCFFFFRNDCRSLQRNPFGYNNIMPRLHMVRQKHLVFFYFSHSGHCDDRLVDHCCNFRVSSKYFDIQFFAGTLHILHHRAQRNFSYVFRQKHRQHHAYRFCPGSGKIIGCNVNAVTSNVLHRAGDRIRGDDKDFILSKLNHSTVLPHGRPHQHLRTAMTNFLQHRANQYLLR